jgi:hypothetical protein
VLAGCETDDCTTATVRKFPSDLLKAARLLPLLPVLVLGITDFVTVAVTSGAESLLSVAPVVGCMALLKLADACGAD